MHGQRVQLRIGLVNRWEEQMMSRYIDAEWLIKESMPLSFSVQKWVNEVQIMTAPSIDIVHCQECKWEWTQKCPPHRMGLIHDENDYCSYGIRKGVNDEAN